MLEPKDHINEKERLASLESYSILDTLPEEDYDNLTAIAAEICGTPISLVSLLDNKRQWFKSRHGLGVSETPKEYAFCAHAINEEDDIFIVQDSRTDERFHDNPLVIGEPRVIFYAGISLYSDTGLPLGTLCVIDHKPKLLSQSQIKSLKALSNQVINLLKLRKSNILLKKSVEELENKNIELERFAYIAAHDLKSPLNTINTTAELFTECYSSKFDEDGKKMLGFIKSSTNKLKGLIDGLLDYSKSESVLKEEVTDIEIPKLKDDINGLFSHDNALNLEIKTNLRKINTNRTALNQILINLVSNAIKYNDKTVVKIQIEIEKKHGYYEFVVKDNGPGIASENQDKIFQIFKILGPADKFGNCGNGIGLATVKRIIEKMGGKIHLDSVLGEGCEFHFTLKTNEPQMETMHMA
ncbi:sensor histidine kinase [Maribacter sp. HTCC2170]|uniref:sensor histidine kinase n=1 Tax=Maribacter sp. (strain HTCC2170 / KCCM 42371) TaxID=313603 RepID=UPI00006B474D|nr:ATP-binding protein [Maribacter sp. HTCC2170]EAR01990.1 histidine kinase response regulator hybrid protein [Maribacter sp. HTCC2170]